MEENPGYISVLSPLLPTVGKGYELKNGELKIEIYIQPSPVNDSLERYLAEKKAQTKENLPESKILEETEIKIDGERAVLLKWEAVGTGETRYLIKNGQRIGITKYPLETSRQAEFDQILSTFKFTDGSNITPTIVSSSKYRYSLEIPSDWTKLAGPPENETLFNFRKGDFEIGLSIIPTTTNTIQSYLQLADQESQTAWEGQPSIKVISTKLTKINAYSVVRREENWLAAAFAKPVVNTYFLYQGNIYSITLKYLGSDSNPTVIEETVYNQALSTFRFNQ
jgi:hypothetical protein